MFRLPLYLAVGLLSLVTLAAPISAHAQKRITVLPLKDRTGSGARMNISEKAADAILQKLSETGKFIVVDRESLAAIQTEKNLKFDADFNPANAPKSGMLAVCDIVVTGQIDEFSANQNSVEKGYSVYKTTEVDGSTALKLTLRVIYVETGQILGSPTARAERKGVLGKSGSTTVIANVGSKTNTANTESALLKLVDSEIEEIATDLAAKITSGPAATLGGGSAKAVVLPKFVGMENGNVVINKGSSAGITVGQSFDIVHLTESDLIDPDTNKPIVRKKKVCTLTISTVDEGTSEGSCPGGTPAKGDELRAVGK